MKTFLFKKKYFFNRETFCENIDLQISSETNDLPDLYDAYGLLKFLGSKTFGLIEL